MYQLLLYKYTSPLNHSLAFRGVDAAKVYHLLTTTLSIHSDIAPIFLLDLQFPHSILLFTTSDFRDLSPTQYTSE